MKKFVVFYVGGIVGLALLYPLVRWSTGEKQAVRIYPSLAAMIPADTQFAMGFQIERLKPTLLYKTLVEGRRIPAIENFAARTGFDPRKSLYEIVIASNGQDPVAFAVGKFSRTTELRQGMEPPIRIEGDRTTRETYKGFTLEGNENASLCFLNSATAMAGPASALRGLIDRQQQNPTPPPALLAAIEAIPLENQVWAVATGDLNGLLGNLKLGSFSLQSLPFHVSRAVFAANLSDGVKGQLSLDCPDGEAAEQLSIALRAAVAFLPARNELSKALEQVEIRREQATVKIRLNLNGAALQQLLGS
ncbi:MAG: hypothetical protein K2X03_13200 [Bryobacteraceae bacterium]|nr:hypothetical protein [Bryobacteraceae bacterium]